MAQWTELERKRVWSLLSSTQYRAILWWTHGCREYTQRMALALFGNLPNCGACLTKVWFNVILLQCEWFSRHKTVRMLKDWWQYRNRHTRYCRKKFWEAMQEICYTSRRRFVLKCPSFGDDWMHKYQSFLFGAASTVKCPCQFKFEEAQREFELGVLD